MKYFLDTEFLEGTQKKRFLGVTVGYTPPTIDLISIGIVANNGKEYYAISKEFNLKEAWYRNQDAAPNAPHPKDYWIRENVLRPIHTELAERYKKDMEERWGGITVPESATPFTRLNLRWLLSMYGKPNSEIAKEVKEFVYRQNHDIQPATTANYKEIMKVHPISFYAYFADYDWVGFCWLFGKMINLPDGFPMFCHDLKQIMEDNGLDSEWKRQNCPDNPDQHNALGDAKWNRKLYRQINQERNKIAQTTIKKDCKN